MPYELIPLFISIALAARYQLLQEASPVSKVAVGLAVGASLVIWWRYHEVAGSRDPPPGGSQHLRSNLFEGQPSCVLESGGCRTCEYSGLAHYPRLFARR